VAVGRFLSKKGSTLSTLIERRYNPPLLSADVTAVVHPSPQAWKIRKFVKDSLDGGASENQVIHSDSFSPPLGDGGGVKLSLQINALPQFIFPSDV
jgi:hypothetical protein